MNSIIIEKNGYLKNKLIKQPDKLYILCNYRNDNSFQNLYNWNFKNYTYELYGKKSGRINFKNNYVFMNEIEEEYYGNLCIIKKDKDKNIMDLTIDEWNNFHVSIGKNNNVMMDEIELEKEIYISE